MVYGPTVHGHAFLAAEQAAVHACTTNACHLAEELATDAALKVIGDPQAAADIGVRAGFKARVDTAGKRL